MFKALTKLGVLVAAAGMASRAQAGGFSVTEYDPQVSGRAFTGSTSDTPSSIIFNPGNMTLGQGLNLSIGAITMMPRFSYASPGDAVTTKTKLSTVVAPTLSITDNLGMTPIGELAAGFGVYAPYGSSFEWPEDWMGRTEGIGVNLQVVELIPALALRPHKYFSIGAGFRFVTSSVYLKQGVDFGSEALGFMEMSGAGNGAGATVGVSAFPLEGLKLGVTWRSQVNLTLKGDANFDFPAPFDAQAVDRPGRALIPLAQELRFGASYSAIPQVPGLTLALEGLYQNWKAYKELAMVFTNPDGTEETVASPRDSHDTWDVGLGAEYKVFPELSVRAGYYYSMHTAPEHTVDPSPPDSDQHIVALGASYFWGRYGAHLHALADFLATRTTQSNALPGEWSGAHGLGVMAYNVGLSLSAALDVPTPFPKATPWGSPASEASPAPAEAPAATPVPEASPAPAASAATPAPEASPAPDATPAPEASPAPAPAPAADASAAAAAAVESAQPASAPAAKENE